MAKWQLLKEYIGVLMGTAVIAAAFNMFMTPNQIAAGGISGLGVLLYYLFNLPVGITIFLLNIPLFAIAVKLFGWHYITRGLFGAVALSIMIEVLTFLPVVTEDLLLASLYGGIVMGIGVALVFRAHGTTGGTDLAAQVLNKIFGFSLGQSLLGVDFLVVALAGIVFNLELSMYALISLFVTSRVIDFVQEGLSSSKAALIISSETESMVARILREMNRGATILTGEGAFTGQKRRMVLTVVAQSEVPRLKTIVHEIDAKAFVILGNAHEVLGEGFSPTRGQA